MRIETVDLKHFQKAQFMPRNFDNVRHVKVLPWLSVVQSVEGSYDIALGNEPVSQQTGSGGFFIAPSGMQQTIVHHNDPASGRIHSRWIFLDAVINKSYRPDFLYDFPTVVPSEAKSELNALFEELFATDDVCAEYGCYYRILGLLLSLATEKSGSSHHAMQHILNYISKHLTENIRIETLAQQANMSSSNLHSVFKKQFGISPVAYINNARLSLAAEYLLASDDPVSEIALRVGIGDPFYFSKMFRKTYTLSPRAYRDKFRFSAAREQKGGV